MKTVDGNLASAKRCAAYICHKYHSAGFHVRQLAEYGAFVINIRSSTTGAWGYLKKLAACSKDITVRIRQDENGSRLTVDASGDYGRQLATGGFGAFVAVGLVAVTAAAGSIDQHRLANAIEEDAASFLEHEASLALTMASR